MDCKMRQKKLTMLEIHAAISQKGWGAKGVDLWDFGNSSVRLTAKGTAHNGTVVHTAGPHGGTG